MKATVSKFDTVFSNRAVALCRLAKAAFLFFAATVLAGCSGSSETAVEDTQVTFRATDTIEPCPNGGCPQGVAEGAPLTIDFIVDNGSKETNGRAWTYTSVKQIVVRVGATYTAIIDPARYIWTRAEGTFTTDASGNFNGVPSTWRIERAPVGEPQKDSNGNYVNDLALNQELYLETTEGRFYTFNDMFTTPSSWTLLP